MRPVTITPDGGRRSLVSLKESQNEIGNFQLIGPQELERYFE
jgi:hypothetical protein